MTAERTQDQCHDTGDRQEPALGAERTVVSARPGPLFDPIDSVDGGAR